MSLKYTLLLISISLFSTVICTAQTLEIWEIQGNGLESPYKNDLVTTENNIVIAVGEDRLFIQTPTNRSDNDPMTSDGVQVYTNNAQNFEVGMLVTVTGRVQEFDGNTQLGNFPTIDIEAYDETLPAPTVLNENFPSGVPAEVHDLERVEGMLVSFNALACGPMNEYEVIPLSTAAERPFREPGILFPGTHDLPVWDGNPEVFWFDPDGLNAPNNRYLGSDMDITATAVFIESDDIYLALPTEYSVQGIAKVRAVRDREGNEFTVASANAFLLYQSTDNYITRLRKLAKYIVESLKSPDILALQEVGNMSALQDLIFYIRQNDPDITYTPYIESGNDLIKVAFLAKNTVSDVQITELGEFETLSLGGALHDRPPLLLEANINTENPTPIKVLNIHARSLIGIEGSNAYFVRVKRHEQAQSIANMIQDLQGSNLIVVGDFNAYQFTDGYVDVVNQIAGLPTEGAQFEPVDIVDPPLINITAEIDPTERYSYVFQGNAQLIDHCLASELQGLAINELQFARGNADNAEAYITNSLIVHRSSDHDAFVLFLEPESPLADFVIAGETFQVNYPNPFSANDEIQLNSSAQQTLQFQLFNAGGQLLHTAMVDTNSRLRIPNGLAAGFYFFQLGNQNGFYSGKLVYQP
jgi:hypothetical protein